MECCVHLLIDIKAGSWTPLQWRALGWIDAPSCAEFDSWEYTLKCDITGSHGYFIFVCFLLLWRSPHPDFQNGCPIVHPTSNIQLLSLSTAATIVDICFLDDMHSSWGRVEPHPLSLLSSISKYLENYFIYIHKGNLSLIFFVVVVFLSGLVSG